MDPKKPAAPREGGGSSSKIANRLVALSSAAVLSVYSAGYLRTKSAADRLLAAERTRVVIPVAQPIAAGPPAVVLPLAAAKPAPEPAQPADATPTKARQATSAADATQTTPAPTPAETAAPAASPVPMPTPVVEPPVPTPPPAPQWKDGTYSGWGTSRHGDIEATVVIENGRIVNAYISQCWTRYSCSWVAHLPGQVVARQSPEVDWVSGATQSVNAFYYGVVQALSKAK